MRKCNKTENLFQTFIVHTCISQLYYSLENNNAVIVVKSSFFFVPAPGGVNDRKVERKSSLAEFGPNKKEVQCPELKNENMIQLFFTTAKTL